MDITVYGASSPTIDSIYLDSAYRLGALMAERGYGLVFGGGAQGVMGAVSRGVQEHGGRSIGIAPRFFDQEGILSKKCTRFFYPDSMRDRKRLMCDIADAFIACPGGFGTFDELFEIITAKQLKRSSKALVLLNTNGFFDGFFSMVDTLVDKNFVKPACLKLYHVSPDPEDALDYIAGYVPEKIDPEELKNLT